MKWEHEMNNKKLIIQVNKLLTERSEKALKIAKKEIVNEKRASKTINDAFNYYTKTWNDVVHPGLLSIACEASGGNAEDAIDLQVATLLLTAGFDVHDDIIDGSMTKHGKPTVFAKFGKNIALLVGDAFLMKALVKLHKLENQHFSEKMDAIWNIIDGLFFELGDAEALEATLKNNIDVSAKDCLRILEMKSSTFEAHMRIGAIVGGGDPTTVELLGKIGRTLGVLVNIREDFIDMFEAEELQSRFENEYLPLPIVYAFKNKHTKKTILDYFSKKITGADTEEIVEIVYTDKNMVILKNEINKIVRTALDSTDKLPNIRMVQVLNNLVKSSIAGL
jgi:geranylgeranyl pyrophosphate synthase